MIWRAARQPVQHVACRWARGIRESDSAKAGPGVALIPQARLRRTVQAHRRVMHALIAWPELHGPHMARGRKGCGNHKRSPHIAPGLRQGIGFGNLQHQVRFAELPALRPPRKGRQIHRVAFRRATGNPFLDQANLFLAQTPFLLELAISRFRQPGRHDALERNFCDLSCPLPVGAVSAGAKVEVARACPEQHLGHDRVGQPQPAFPVEEKVVLNALGDQDKARLVLIAADGRHPAPPGSSRVCAPTRTMSRVGADAGQAGARGCL